MKHFNNFLKKSKIKLLVTLVVLLFSYVIVSAYGYTKAVSNDLSASVFRLHVIANSDSDEDQNLKSLSYKFLLYLFSLSILLYYHLNLLPSLLRFWLYANCFLCMVVISFPNENCLHENSNIYIFLFLL